MHEFSVMQQVVETVLSTVREKKGVIGVEEVTLEVGELTFLGHEPLRFSFQVLAENEPLLREAKLVLKEKKAVAKCPNCGYVGGLEYDEDISYHYAVPIFSCPRCGDVVDIVEGNECAITNIRVVVDDEEPF